MAQRPKICLSLTGKTIAEDLEILNKFRNWIDIAELRVDYLTKDERLYVRRFPEKAGLPCILTIRRRIDGGQFLEGEASRTTLFARALAFAEQDVTKNFAYIDLESDFSVPSLHDAALAFGTSVIRTYHSLNAPVKNLVSKFNELRFTGYEIPKITCMPHSLSELTKVMKEAKELRDTNHILSVLGPFGIPATILASRTNSCIAYTCDTAVGNDNPACNNIDPRTLDEIYDFNSIDKNTEIYGITGFPLDNSDSSVVHNRIYKEFGMNAVYIPFRSKTIEEAMEFAEETNIRGFSVTNPFKKEIVPNLRQISEKVGDTGVCSIAVNRGNDWIGYNTEPEGLQKALCEFLAAKNLAHRRVSIIGGGSVARAAALAVKQLRGKACVFNRTLSKAKRIAEQYGFKYAALEPGAIDLLELYSDLIIQTTSVGQNYKKDLQAGKQAESYQPYDYQEIRNNPENDPIYFYKFRGHEAVYDVIYNPSKTPLLERAENAGCRVANGYTLLEFQAVRQFELYTGKTKEVQQWLHRKLER
ncbi:MAG: type I 3-dehydroquinate dehydratase [Treponemataceae bacterium]|nr:type I 3-dehydroquinate dehydratase [Treponemataceae bacterium]